jgi:hypothetical protein
MTGELAKLLDSPGHAAQAKQVGRAMANEDGARAAADALEKAIQ